jgi:hypothetical protein
MIEHYIRINAEQSAILIIHDRVLILRRQPSVCDVKLLRFLLYLRTVLHMKHRCC